MATRRTKRATKPKAGQAPFDQAQDRQGQPVQAAVVPAVELEQWMPTGYRWSEAARLVNAGIEAESEEYREKHGLRGVFAGGFMDQVVVGQVRGDAVLLPLDIIGGMKAVDGLTVRHGNGRAVTQLVGTINEALQELVAGVDASGFVAAFANLNDVRCMVYEHAGVQAIRFDRDAVLTFGEPEQEPVTHHLLSVALRLRERYGLPEYLEDRNVLRGAW